MTDVIVIGGGLAGLAAAALAADAGAEVVLLERSGALGGRARSERVEGGWTLNLGPHALYLGGGGAAVLDRLGVAYEGAAPDVSGAQVLIGGELAPLPASPAGLLRSPLLGVTAQLHFARALSAARRARPHGPLAGVPLGAWLDGRFGPDGNARALFEVLTRLTTYSHDLSASAGAVLHQLAIGTKPGVRYLDGGWQRLVDGLMQRAVRAGVTVRDGVRVTSLDRRRQGWDVQTQSGPLAAAEVIIAAGGPKSLLSLAGEHLSQPVRDRAAAAVPVRAATLDVALRSLPESGNGYAFGADLPLYLSVHSLSADLAPAGGATLHGAYYLGSKASDPTRHRSAIEDLLDRVQPGWRDVAEKVRFLPDITVAHDLPAAAAGGLAGRVPVTVGDGLHLAGDWVGSRGLLADASLLSAEAASEAVAAAQPSPARSLALNIGGE